MPSNKINCVQTNGPTIWIGTDNGLVNYTNGTTTIYNTSNSLLPTNKIRALALSISGKLWIGTFSGGGLASFDGSNWQVFTPSNSDLPNNSVSVIKENTNGDLWIGTGSGISVFNGSNFTNYNPEIQTYLILLYLILLSTILLFG